MRKLRNLTGLAAAAALAAAMGFTSIAAPAGEGQESAAVEEGRLAGMLGLDGTVISLEDGRLHMMRRVEGGTDELVVTLSEDTKILDAVNGFPVPAENLDAGEAVRVYVGPAMAQSLPPIANGLMVIADAPADFGFPEYAVVESLIQEPDKADGTGAEYILETTDGKKYTVSGSTTLLPYLTRNMVYVTDLKAGTPVLLWKDAADAGKAGKIVLFQRENQNEAKDPEDGLGFHGWKEEDGDWYYYDQGQLKTGWYDDGEDWFYLDPETGRMETGFVTVDGNTYFLQEDGRMLTEETAFVPDENGVLHRKK